MGNNKTLWVLGHKVTYVETIGDYSLMEVSLTSGIPGPPPHYHVDAPELFHLIDGEMDVMLNGTWHSLTKGESIMIPKNSVHSFRGTGDGDSRFITTWSPRGFEGFFLEFGVPITEENAFEKSVSDEMIKKVVTGCGKYGMIVVEND